MPTVHQRVAAARQRFHEAGIGPRDAEISARLLAERALGWDKTRYFTSAHEPEPPGFAASYEAFVARREAREPAAYIMGVQDFWTLSFEVSPAVLIPRHETEIIVEAAIDLFGSDRQAPLHIADACTGSGCLAVSLAHEFPRATLVATDISEVALEVARRNAVRHAVADRIRFECADVLESIEGPFDFIVANPPYVLSGDRPGLQPEVRDYEPAVALYGGIYGMDLVRRLVEQASVRLRQDGYVMFEFGLGQDDEIEQLISATSGLRMVALRRDLQGIARTAIAQRV